MEEYLNIAVISVFSFLCLAVGMVFYLVRKNESLKKTWIRSIDVNDKCNYHFVSGTTPDDMKISKIRDDGKFEITFIAQDRFLYPPHDKK